MNRVYRVIWNEAQGTWMAVAETAKASTKKSQASRSRKRKLMNAAVVGFAMTPLMANAECYFWGLFCDQPNVTNITNVTNVVPSPPQDPCTTAVTPGPLNPKNCVNGGTGDVTIGSQTVGSDGTVYSVTKATGGYATAVGAHAQATASSSVALGINAKARAIDAIGIGDQAWADGIGSVSVGRGSRAPGISSVALGTTAQATGDRSLALSAGAATADDAVAMGDGAAASGQESLAIGKGAAAVGLSGIAIGSNASTVGHSLALGDGSIAAADKSVALGMGANAAGYRSVALGAGSDGSRNNAVSVGAAGDERYIVNVRAGKEDTDAVNVSQLKDAVKDITGDGTLRPLPDNIVAYTDSTHGTVALSGSGGTLVTGVREGALSASSKDAVNGSQLFATNKALDDIRVGGAKLAVTYDADAKDQITLNKGGKPTLITNLAPGKIAEDSTDALTGGELHQLLGGLGMLDGDGRAVMPVLFNGPAKEANINGKKLINVAAGTISTDGVNYGQLKSLESEIKTGIKNGVSYDDDTLKHVTLGGLNPDAGKGENPLVVPNGVQIHNLKAGESLTDAVNLQQLKTFAEAAATGLDPNTKTVVSSAIQYDKTAGGVIDYSKATLKGDAGTTISNVQAGALNDKSTDAVNGSQLYVTNQEVDKLKKSGVGLVQQDTTTRVITVGKDTDGGTVDFSGTSLTDATKKNTRVLTGVSAGMANADAVNVQQLKSAGFDLGKDGAVQNAAVTYQAGSIAGGSPRVVLAPGEGNSPYFASRADQLAGKHLPKGTVISNVANAQVDTDAVNLGQMMDELNKQTGGNVVSGGGVRSRVAPPEISFRSLPVPQNALKVAAAPVGSGADVAGKSQGYDSKNWYLGARGLGNSAGSLGPTDAAITDGAASVAIGSDSKVSVAADGGVALGVATNVTAKDAVALGAGSVADQGNTVSVGSSTNQRRVVNVAAGTKDADAVNLKQLKDAG
ncbi:hypothetical protein FCJ61_40400, partial [Burkholderia metallica]|uniref:ESPR-type extended signal peptide-containing protein n=1 Tax=Burkholderia metallica TaxID=488729 RepID=UPI00157B4848